ncbi:MAG: GerMN domain-containing protein [Bacillales bacterium]|nr:GerMN domain-containing protein [Bacillales bacterium]
MMVKKKTLVAAAVILSSVYLTGCGLLVRNEKKENIDPPQKVTYLKEEGSLKELKHQSAQDMKKEDVMMTDLYLIDKNGYVVSQTLPLPKTQSIAKEALEYLVDDGPVSNMLPNGFRAVLPAGTEVRSVHIKDGKAIADFSPEFKEYNAEDEKKILQAITWTLTQFDAVKKVELRVDGQPLKEMPVDGTAIDPNGLSRNIGINWDVENVVDIANTRPITVYYLAQDGENDYYVPVTKRVSNNNKDNVTAVVNELIKGPSPSSELVSEFMPDVKLISAPVVKDGKVTLNFNKSILGSFEEKMISKNTLNPLVLSLTEQKGIKSVTVEVDGKTNLVDDKGKPISETVSRPQHVNTGSF